MPPGKRLRTSIREHNKKGNLDETRIVYEKLSSLINFIN